MKPFIRAMCHCIPRTAFSGVLVLAIPCHGQPVALAADSIPADFAAYQLRLENAAAFRLVTANPEAPAAEARQEPDISSRFANHRFAKLIAEAARKAALDPALVHAVIAVESAYNPAARSTKGAIGLMQVLPGTAARYGVPDPASSPEANVLAGTRFLSHLMDLFDNRLELVLAAYNAGEHAVLRHGLRIPPFRETQQYVPAVLARYRAWRETVPPVPPVASAPVLVQYTPGTRLESGARETAVNYGHHGDYPGRQ